MQVVEKSIALNLTMWYILAYQHKIGELVMTKEEKIEIQILQLLSKLEYLSPAQEATFLAGVLSRQINSQQDWMRKISLETTKEIIFKGEK